MLQIVLLLIAVILAGLAAFGVGAPRFNLLAGAVCFLALAFLAPLLGA
jgi:hypothetical protein